MCFCTRSWMQPGGACFSSGQGSLSYGCRLGAGPSAVGLITLGTQAGRRSFGLELEGFWIGVGFLFIVGGIWRLFSIQFSPWPILWVAAGVALFASIFAGGLRNLVVIGKTLMVCFRM